MGQKLGKRATPSRHLRACNHKPRHSCRASHSKVAYGALSRGLTESDVAVANGRACADRLVDDARVSRLRPAGFVSTKCKLNNVAHANLFRAAISDLREVQKNQKV